MSLIKIKAKIYQVTGIYLAHKEELEYVTSKAFWKAFKKMTRHAKKNDFSAENIQGILIGLWQCKHEFYTSFPLKWRIQMWLKRRFK